MQFRNISPAGDLDVVGVGHVPHGGTFDVVGDAAQSFLDQSDIFEHIPATRPKKAEKPETAEAAATPPAEGDQL